MEEIKNSIINVEDIETSIIKCLFRCKATAKGLTTGKDVEEIETPIPKCDAVNRGASWKSK